MQARDPVHRHREESERISIAKIVLGGEGEAREVVEGFQVLRPDAGGIEQRAVPGIAAIGVGQGPLQALALYRPQPEAVDAYVAQNGLNAFYDSVEMRRECCRVRKVEPLGRALAGNKAWVTGQRRAQSSTRAELHVQEDDPAHGMVKFNPLADWSEQDVWNYIRDHGVPYNALHDQGYPSIGCAPCTRAIEPGEDVRAGRWWWENPDSKECGLHMVDGKLIRIKSVAA